MAEGGRSSGDRNQEVDDGITGDAMPAGVNVISGGTHELTIQGGEFEQFIQKRVNYNTFYADSATGRPAKHEGALPISDVLFLLENAPICMSSRVFRAIHSDVTGDKIVVVKITPADKIHQREAKIYCSVPHHKNIVERIAANFFHFRAQPSIYIAMECCDCNLDDHIKSQVENGITFDPQKYLSISRQIVAGLTFLHLHKVVHGDLKPRNVLMILGKNVVKLCDFGLSRTIRDDKTATQVTSPQGGTTGWLAPEILLGTDKISFKNDIFPLGLVTFYCLSYGKHPYGDVSVSWNYYILNGKNRNLDIMLIPGADAAKVLLESMLQQNPTDRPTAEEVLKDIVFASVGQDDGIISEGVGRVNFARTTENDSCPISLPSVGKIQPGIRQMKIKFAYEAENSGELSLEPGDLVEIIKDVEEGWAEGLKVDGKKGVFPVHFGEMMEGSAGPVVDRNKECSRKQKEKQVNAMAGSSQQTVRKNLASASSSKPSTKKEDPTAKSITRMSHAIVTSDYPKSSNAELNLVKGEIILILNKNPGTKGWWKGEKEVSGKTVKGLFPCNFVTELTAVDAEDQLPGNSTQDAFEENLHQREHGLVNIARVTSTPSIERFIFAQQQPDPSQFELSDETKSVCAVIAILFAAAVAVVLSSIIFRTQGDRGSTNWNLTSPNVSSENVMDFEMDSVVIKVSLVSGVDVKGPCDVNVTDKRCVGIVVSKFYGDGFTFMQAEEICKKSGSTLAVFVDEKVYNEMITAVHYAMKSYWSSLTLLTGMRLNNDTLPMSMIHPPHHDWYDKAWIDKYHPVPQLAYYRIRVKITWDSSGFDNVSPSDSSLAFICQSRQPDDDEVSQVTPGRAG